MMIFIIVLGMLAVTVLNVSHSVNPLVHLTAALTELVSSVGNTADRTESDNTLDDLLYVHNRNLQI